MFTKIWERYFLKEFLKGFFLFLIAFYGLYVLIDYANHTTSLHHHHVTFSIKDFVFYYGCEFLKRLGILLPFAILIATIRTLCNLNVHNELVALMASGLSIKKALLPFLWIGLAAVLCVYLNMETTLPAAMKKLQYLEDIQKSEKNKHSKASVNHLILEDESLFLFFRYDSVERHFFDTYWIKSFDEIYKIKILNPHEMEPVGYDVNHLVRDSNGNLIIVNNFEKMTFPLMKFHQEKLLETIIPAENLALSSLWNKLSIKLDLDNEKEAKIQTAFIYKLILPWLCLLAVIGPAPFCLYFTRHLPVFFIYAGSIFGLLICYLTLDAAKVLGERQVIAPLFALGIPFILFSFLLTYRYSRRIVC